MEFSNVIVGIGAGIAYSLVGFAKTREEAFDFNKFGLTLVTGAVVGAVSGFMNLEMDAANEFVLNVGGIALLENIYKAIVRRFIK